MKSAAMKKNKIITEGEILDKINLHRVKMFEIMKIVIIFSALVSCVAVYFWRSFYIILAVPIPVFLFFIIYSKLWINRISEETKISQEAIAKIWKSTALNALNKK